MRSQTLSHITQNFVLTRNEAGPLKRETNKASVDIMELMSILITSSMATCVFSTKSLSTAINYGSVRNIQLVYERCINLPGLEKDVREAVPHPKSLACRGLS